MLSSVGTYLYLMGGFDGYECLRDVERIDLASPVPRIETLKSLNCPIKNGVCYYRDG